MKLNQQNELIAFKLKSFQAEAIKTMGSTREDAIRWLVKHGLQSSIPNIPRMDQFNSLLKLAQQNQQFYLNAFGSQETICQLFDECRELYDYAFLIEQLVRIKGQGVLSSIAVLGRLQRKFTDCLQKSGDSQSLFYLQGIYMYIAMRQSSTAEPAATFLGAVYDRQRKQAAKVYKWVIKPLFQKKNLKPLYVQLVDLVGWLIFMEAEPELINDLAKKLNSFVLYHKSDSSIEMISVCNRLYDLLSVHFPRQAGLNHFGLASLIVKLKSYKLDNFLDLWLDARFAFINTLDFEYLLRNLTEMGTGSFVLDVLGRIWAFMKRNNCYNVLLKIFSGYIRKEYLRLWLEKGEELSRYIKLGKYFMIGLCNRERFQGQQIDILTENLCFHLIKRGVTFSLVYREIIQFYALYENRFSYLSQTSKRFLRQIKELYNTTIDTAQIHALFNEYTIRQLDHQEEEEYWHKGKVSYRYRGLQNMGNTCYINSFMQCLYMTKKFRGLIHQLTKDDALPSDKLKAYALHNLFQELSKKSLNNHNPFRPQYFRMELPPPFNNTPHQQDTGQFGRIYLEMLVKELGQEHGHKLQKMLIQRLQKTIRCMRCNQQKRQTEKVFDLIVNIDRQESALYLSKLLQQYFSPQKFTGQNRVYCGRCQNKQDAVTQLFPEKFSEVVVVTLSLFDYIGEGRKILTPLMFEFSLNFDVLLNQKQLGEYELYAFIVHLGSHLGGGHYICYARNLQQNPISWYCLDDGYVTEREIGKVQDFAFGENQTPYMLFYSRKQSGLKHSKTIT